MLDKAKLNRYVQLERQAAYKKGFVRGLVTGIFIPVLLVSILVITGIFLQRDIEEKVGEYLMGTVLTEVFSAFPDAYFTLNRERIIKILDDFTNAASKHKISNQEFRQIGRKFLDALKDRQLSYAELDAILALMKEAAQN